MTITHLDPQSGGGMPSGGVSSAGSAELSAPAARGVAPVGGVVPLQTFWQAGYEGMIGA